MAAALTERERTGDEGRSMGVTLLDRADRARGPLRGQRPYIASRWPMPMIVPKPTQSNSIWRPALVRECRSRHDDLTQLTDSQQITLLALIREALSNVREHAEAQHVSVVLSARGEGLSVGPLSIGSGAEGAELPGLLAERRRAMTLGGQA